MYGIYANIWGIMMVNVTIYSIHGSYGIYTPLGTILFYRGTTPKVSAWHNGANYARRSNGVAQASRRRRRRVRLVRGSLEVEDAGETKQMI